MRMFLCNTAILFDTLHMYLAGYTERFLIMSSLLYRNGSAILVQILQKSLTNMMQTQQNGSNNLRACTASIRRYDCIKFIAK